MRVLKVIIFVIIILFIGCSCSTSTEDVNITDDVESNINKSDIDLIDEYYPLDNEMQFTPMYLPDCANYSEEAIHIEGDFYVVFMTYGGKSSDIVFLEKNDLLIYEIFRLVADEETEERKLEYIEIINMIIEKKGEDALREKFKEIIEQIDEAEKKIYLIHPSLGVTKWDGGEIVEYESDEELLDMPEYIKKGIIIADENIIIVKRESDYYFYQKDQGIVIYYNSSIDFSGY